jgi:hypothetical protein
VVAFEADAPVEVAPTVEVDAPDFAQPAAVIAMPMVSALTPSFKIMFIALLTLVFDFHYCPGGVRPVFTQAQVYTMLSPNHNHLNSKKIALDLSTTLGEYSGLENTPLSPPTQIHRSYRRSLIKRVNESGRM